MTTHIIQFEKRIDDNEIYIGSSSTTYCNVRKFDDFLSLKKALKLRKEVIEEVVSKGGRVVYKNKTKGDIESKGEQALSEYNLYLDRYEELKKMVLDVFKGVEVVTFEEKVAMEEDLDRIHNLRYEIERMFHGSTTLSQYNSVLFLLQDHKSRIEHETDLTGTTFYL